MTDGITRWVRGYHSKDENLVVEHRLADRWSTAMLQQLVGAPEDDPLYDAYRLDQTQLGVLEADLGISLQRPGVEFFLECDAA